MIAIAWICAVISGVANPLRIIFFGRSVNDFATAGKFVACENDKDASSISLQSRSIIVRSIIVRFLAFLKKNFKNADILDNYGTNFILVFKEE